jgi:release factor glutamine methyltransferase
MTRAEALTQTRDALRAAGIDDPSLDARLLVADALRIDALGLVTGAGDPVPADARERLASHRARRIAREPVGRILGSREFWGLPFRLSPETLEPRPDTETLVETALARIPDRNAPLSLLDLGTGTGCILVALLSELPRARGLGIDRAEGAARIARANAAANGVGDRAAFLVGDWAGAVGDGFDLVVSNPPYIRADVVPTLGPEVTEHDPGLALDGGMDGLVAYRAILADLDRLLAPGGFALLEIGFDQSDDLARLTDAAGFDLAGVAADLGGRPRVVTVARRRALQRNLRAPSEG